MAPSCLAPQKQSSYLSPHRLNPPLNLLPFPKFCTVMLNLKFHLISLLLLLWSYPHVPLQISWWIHFLSVSIWALFRFSEHWGEPVTKPVFSMWLYKGGLAAPRSWYVRDPEISGSVKNSLEFCRESEGSTALKYLWKSSHQGANRDTMNLPATGFKPTTFQTLVQITHPLCNLKVSGLSHGNLAVGSLGKVS